MVLHVLSKNIQKIGRRSESNICPSLSGWEGRSQVLCSSDQSMYHCLLARDDFYLEACITAIYVEPGYFPRIAEGLDRLYKEPCPSDMYQPEGEMSNRFKKVKCTYMKAKCDGLGEEYCNHGNTTQDVECRCDYLKGYRAYRYFLQNPERKKCYTKKEEDGCMMFPCSNSSEELNPAYQCVPVCEYGYHRPPDKSNCIPNKTTSVKPDIATTVPNQRTTTAAPPVHTHPSLSPDYKTPQTSSKVENWKIAGIIVAVILTVVVVILVIYFLMEKYFRIHTNYGHFIQKAHNETVILEADVPHFPCFDIEFQWKLIRNEDDGDEESDLPENDRFQVNSEVRSRSSLTISSITVKDEAEYVCRANLKCWKRIADRYATKLIVKGGDFYHTPVPSPKLETKASAEIENISGTPLPGVGTTVIYRSGQTITGDATFNIYNIKNYGKNNSADDDDEDQEDKHNKKKKHKKPKRHRNSSSSSNEYVPLMDRKPQKHFSLKEEKEKMDILAKSKLQIRIDDVPGDGNCLYHAFLRNKNIHNLPDNPQELRRQLVKFLESNPDAPNGTSYKDFLCLPRDQIMVT
uniref:Uncharacterized protein LOC111131863 isoform X2 n=1 Tax=Crassostrea virginica TaxID=6565 RepID=A0A8B8E6K2_CRAVI|nr:uncharacterized protein LOC111131863 isoform X2 [Crassostrea virginica]